MINSKFEKLKQNGYLEVIKLPPLKSYTTEKGGHSNINTGIFRDVTPNCHNVENLYFYCNIVFIHCIHCISL